MLYVVLLFAFVFYASLFVAWGTISTQFNHVTSSLGGFYAIVFAVPDPTVLIVLKEVILFALAYAVVDTVMATIRHYLRPRSPAGGYHDYPAEPVAESADLVSHAEGR